MPLRLAVAMRNFAEVVVQTEFKIQSSELKMKKTLIISTIFLISFLLVACGGKKSSEGFTTSDVHNPMTAEGLSKKDAEKMPVIAFETLEYDFGRVIKGERLSYAFKFKNTGKSNLIISSARSSCGCTTSTPPQAPIRPGESGEISVVFDSKSQKGEVNKLVVVSANTYPVQTTLRLKATVVEP